MEKKLTCDCTVLHEHTIANVQKSMPKELTLKQLSNLYKNFADSTRAKILCALNIEEMCVCDLASLFGMTVSAISHQLKFLRNSDLVRFRKEGKVVFYSLADDHVRTILAQGFDHLAHQNGDGCDDCGKTDYCQTYKLSDKHTHSDKLSDKHTHSDKLSDKHTHSDKNADDCVDKNTIKHLGKHKE